jgi:hypothetical protein
MTTTVTFTAHTNYAPFAPLLTSVYWQVDSRQGPWGTSVGGSGNYSAQFPALRLGTHFLYAYAGEPQIATANDLSSPVIGNITAYEFTVVP